MPEITVHRLGQAPPIRLAAQELRRCLSQVTGLPVHVRAARRPDPTALGLWLGQFADFGLPARRGSDPVGSGRAALDDEILIRVGPDGGTIAGSNERSVLLAAYRYLTELGCRWVRPGKTGEYLPRLGPGLPAVEVRERASYRHRGVCIEGATSPEHALGMVDWCAKRRMNTVFLQFIHSRYF